MLLKTIGILDIFKVAFAIVLLKAYILGLWQYHQYHFHFKKL